MTEQAPTIVKRIRDHSRNYPSRIAVNFGSEKLLFEEIENRSNAVANALLASQIRRQSRIAILAKNTPAFYELLLGAAKADVVLVPVNYRLAPLEIAFILGDSEVELLFVAQEFVPTIERIRDNLTGVREIFVIDGSAGAMSQFVAWRDGRCKNDLHIDVSPEAVTAQMYTSGTTGRPKGALLTHSNLVQSLRGSLPAWGSWHDRDVILVCMPQYHIGASIWGIAGLWQGVESVLMGEFNADQALRIIEDYRVTKTQLVPVMIKMMLDSSICTVTDFSSLELVVYGAAPAPLDLVKRVQREFGCGI